jgi:hypothetical protein
MKKKATRQNARNQVNFEREVINLIIQNLEVSNGDAQAIYEVEELKALRYYLNGSTAQETFKNLFQ